MSCPQAKVLSTHTWCRQLKGGDGEAEATKHALWRELAEAGFARTASAIWLLPLLQLLLRVQLNILGRQLFMESNLMEPRYDCKKRKCSDKYICDSAFSNTSTSLDFTRIVLLTNSGAGQERGERCR